MEEEKDKCLFQKALGTSSRHKDNLHLTVTYLSDPRLDREGYWWSQSDVGVLLLVCPGVRKIKTCLVSEILLMLLEPEAFIAQCA
jgi:hypothetical protein